MENIQNTEVTQAPAPLTDEELAALLASPVVVTTDDGDEKDEDKVTLN